MGVNSTQKRWLPLCLVLLLGVAGCESVATMGASIASSSGLITDEQAQSFVQASRSLAKAFTDITPEQEYYIGRAVAATVVSRYRPYPARAATRYINLVGQTLAAASDRPETFRGYHFLILDTDEINAFAAPGGLIFVSRGLLHCCRSEDALAAVLAHEIGHVQQKHGLQAIKKSRLTAALTDIAAQGAKEMSNQELNKLTTLFEDSVKDVTLTLFNNGYSRGFEREADAAAVTLLERVGYDPHALDDMLTIMAQRLPPGGPGFARTHPAPANRIAEIDKLIVASGKPVAMPQARQQRFLAAMGGV